MAGSTETVAVEQPDGSHKLFGYKWFSSATDSDMSLTLANIISEDQPEPVMSLDPFLPVNMHAMLHSMCIFTSTLD